jgi:hypothetical protein
LTAAEALTGPLDDTCFDLLDARYAYVREFAPAVVAALDLRAGPGSDAILEGVELLRRRAGRS